MFERYTESARKVLFFARYETSASGGLAIESEHLLVGLLREPGPIVRRLFVSERLSIEPVRRQIEREARSREKVPTSVEIPFSAETKTILEYTAEEADSLGHAYIGTEHILLAILRLPESIAGSILTDHGLRLHTARQDVAALIADMARPKSDATADPDPPAPTVPPSDVDPLDITSHIDRIQQIVEQLRVTLPYPHEAHELVHLLQMELVSLKGRFF
jgi:ATP-dependent Clp protease ATP-binding subunit ClpA